jgi:hypothetical protein
MLFKKLPDDIFKPLAGANRKHFEEILLYLFDYFSGDHAGFEDAFPRRPAVKAVITELLARKGRMVKISNEEGVDEDSGKSVDRNCTPEQAAEYIYRRLLESGWLEEEQDGYNFNVLMPPHANLLLEALVSVANSDRKNYGSTVASINLQLEQISNRPEHYAQAFIEVVRAARDFTRHLQNIIAGLRGYQDAITRQQSPVKALMTFFDDFVETLLISDYKSLQYEDNPFRHRANVYKHLQFIEHDPKVMAALIKVYQDDKKLSEVNAREKVLADLYFIAKVFHSVDRRLDAIDIYRRRLESRMAEIVRYMDRQIPNLANRSVKVLNKLGQISPEITDADLPGMPQPASWVSIRLLAAQSLFRPKVKRKPEFLPLDDEEEISQEARERLQMEREYLRLRSVTPQKIGAFIKKQLDGKVSVEAKDIRIDSVDDLIAFCFVPFMDQIGGKGLLRKGSIVVKRTEKRLDTHYMECPDFVIERKT